MKQASKTFGSRSIKNVLATVAGVMIIILAVALWICYGTLKSEVHVRYVGLTNVAAEKVAKTIQGMEMNAKNVFDEVEKHLDSPDAVIEALMSKTSLNPEVKGYFAAFEPNYFEQKGYWFEPYVHHRDSGGFLVNQVGSARHDYTKSGWYVSAKETCDDKPDAGFWSEPYYYHDNDEIGLSGHYCTYVKSVFDKNGAMACVCGADMTLEWLSKKLRQIDDAGRTHVMLNRFYQVDPDFYTVVLNHDGSTVANPDGKPMSITDGQVLRDLKEKKSGMIDMTVNGVASRVYYTPIENINWAMALIVPHQNVWSLLALPGLLLLVLALIGLVVIFVVTRMNFSKYREGSETS